MVDIPILEIKQQFSSLTVIKSTSLVVRDFFKGFRIGFPTIQDSPYIELKFYCDIIEHHYIWLSTSLYKTFIWGFVAVSTGYFFPDIVISLYKSS